MYQLRAASKADHTDLIEIWEASVRATHDFLPEEDIVRLKPLILEHYFDAVDLVCATDANGVLQGFCGVHDSNIEMLFIAPQTRGRGLGKILLQYAIAEQQASKVDVNEQNGQAVEFYEAMGFAVTGRSELDGEGKPFPLLHMKIA